MADDREQIVWQLRAGLVYVDLMREQIKGDLLPILRWTVGSAGCGLVGEPKARSDDGKQAAIRAWGERLNLAVTETDLGSGMTSIHAQGRYREVRVTIGATLYGDDEEAEQ